ncbi:B-block binding subunit of TFIIIC, partial [Zea mays]
MPTAPHHACIQWAGQRYPCGGGVVGVGQRGDQGRQPRGAELLQGIPLQHHGHAPGVPALQVLHLSYERQSRLHEQPSFTSKQKQQRVGSGLTPVRRKRRVDGTSLKLLKRTVQAIGSAEQILGQPIVDEEVPMISRYAILRKSCMRSKRFFWTCESDRKLLMAYIRVRAVLGARYYRVPWKSLSDLPAPPHTCLRRMTLLLKTNGKIRGAVMCLCNLLGERYVRYLEKERRLKRRRLFPQISNRSQENSLDSNCEQFNWDDFEVLEIKSALNEVLELIQTEKIDQAKRIGPVNQKTLTMIMMSQRTQYVHRNCQIIRLYEVKPKRVQFQKADSVILKNHADIQMQKVKTWKSSANLKKKSLRITEIRLLKEAYGNHWLLRNPIRVEVKTEAKYTSKVAGRHELGPSITPLGLRLEYMICEASKKSSQVVDFLVHNSGKKIMVYFATCACVDYWAVVLPLINSLKGSPIIASHGKMKQ